MTPFGKVKTICGEILKGKLHGTDQLISFCNACLGFSFCSFKVYILPLEGPRACR